MKGAPEKRPPLEAILLASFIEEGRPQNAGGNRDSSAEAEAELIQRYKEAMFALGQDQKSSPELEDIAAKIAALHPILEPISESLGNGLAAGLDGWVGFTVIPPRKARTSFFAVATSTKVPRMRVGPTGRPLSPRHPHPPRYARRPLPQSLAKQKKSEPATCRPTHPPSHRRLPRPATPTPGEPQLSRCTRSGSVH